MMEEASDTWVKILDNSKSSGVNYEDAIKEFLLDKLIAVVKHPDNETVHKEYVNFMKELSVMFEKLRRFPKMISKFLVCIRTEIVKEFEDVDNQGIQHKPWTRLVLPPQFMVSIEPIVSLLPSGQIVDLWKTIHHNLEEECIKKISNDEDNVGVRHFLSIVVDLLKEFLLSIKVADTSVPITQIEQIGTLMLKLQNDCLEKLGTALLKRNHDSTLLHAFLKLTYIWSELHALMLLYNSKYKNSRVRNDITTVAAIDLNDLQNNTPLVSKISSLLTESKMAFNLSCIHPYLSPKSWLQVGKAAIDSDESSCKILMVKLVAQKMKYLRVLQGKCLYLQNKSGNEHSMNNDNNTPEPQNMGTTVEIKCDHVQLQNLIGEHIEEAANFLWLEQAEWLALRELHDVFLISSECLEPSNMMTLAGNFVTKMVLMKSKEINLENQEEVKVEKQVLTLLDMEEGEKKCNSIEFESELETLNDNPIFCTAVLLEVAREIIRRLGKMKLHKKCTKKLTRDVMSITNLTVLLQNFTHEQESFKNKKVLKSETTEKESEKIVDKILNFVNEFMEDNTNQDATNEQQSNVEFSGELIENLLEFLCTVPLEDYTSEIKTFLGLCSIYVLIAVGPYGKDNHVNSLIAKLATKCAMNARGNVTLFAVKWHTLFHWLTLHFDFFSLNASKQILSVILSNIYISKKCIEDFEPVLNKLCDSFGSPDTVDSVQKILLITQKTLMELTASASKAKSKLTPCIESHSKKVTQLVVDLLEKEESGLNITVEKIEAILSSEEELDESKVVSVTKLLDKLVDVELEVEKRAVRRRLVEEYLYKILDSTLHWKEYAVASYTQVIEVQLKILRRRHALGSLKSLANCFVSITAIPFKCIEEMTTFRKVFCKAANLLNAFTVHRLDVVSFRTHIDLQCFQFLVESLTTRADQRNKLTDSEIYDLIYCAHAVERVCQSAKLGQKEFSRVSPYFVAILMRQFEMFTVYPAVKNPLMSGCYKLLDLCDDHGVAQVNSMLSVGSREIFKTVYELYKKYYRYSGRV